MCGWCETDDRNLETIFVFLVQCTKDTNHTHTHTHTHTPKKENTTKGGGGGKEIQVKGNIVKGAGESGLDGACHLFVLFVCFDLCDNLTWQALCDQEQTNNLRPSQNALSKCASFRR